jgi:hypothetical protein
LTRLFSHFLSLLSAPFLNQREYKLIMGFGVKFYRL